MKYYVATAFHLTAQAKDQKIMDLQLRGMGQKSADTSELSFLLSSK